MLAGGNRLSHSFYEAYDTCSLAQKLLGCELVHDSPDGVASGIIVETEAYLHDDPASHAYMKRTTRSEPMYAAAGTIYVYLIYGMYQCFNVVSREEGVGEAVLIRALEPKAGIELMTDRREITKRNQGLGKKPVSVKELCRGPGKLVVAMGIDKQLHNGKSLATGSLFILPAVKKDFQIDITKRVGISQGADLFYRYSIHGNEFVSKGPMN